MGTIEIISSHEIQNTLEPYFVKHGYADLCCFHKDDSENGRVTIRYRNQERQYSTPVRLGDIIDQVNSYKNKEHNHVTLPQFGEYTLHHEQFFLTNGHKTISLTEKEVEILTHLHENKGKVIARDVLLHTIWNYAQNVETHTLETHIYRLRQKIEDDPTQPKILITDGDGYMV